MSDNPLAQTSSVIDADWAFARYEAVRPRLPMARFAKTSVRARDLSEVADRYDAFVLDAFGVLNVGDTPIPGAVARMAELRARGKRWVVLTNAASYTRADALVKYRRLGFDFTAKEVVSSRDVAVARLAAIAPGALWAAASAAGDGFGDISARVIDLIDTPDAFDQAEAFLFLSSTRWTPGLQQRLMQSLQRRPRPLVVANPDLVAPREDGLSLEPGLFAHELIDQLGLVPHWFGKPFADGFEDALARLDGVARDRIAMVGDTLHTDILGGAAAGLGTILITAHGLFAGRDVTPYIAQSGIQPDVIVATT
ncbi:MAG: TIGR01459 family HAD-type hydrolase [Paracoccaceae bacterium]|nr:TIGR01459 family HAD-type hydrolase [Paracoccaceae bacterium]